MKSTPKINKALDIAFNGGVVRNMTPEEYGIYIQQLMILSLSTVRANKGDKFVEEFVSAALITPVLFETKQVANH